MAMNDEQRLDCGWIATADIGSEPDADSMIHLGSFNTLIGFWRFFNNLGQQQPMDRLPHIINFRLFRNIIASKLALNERDYAAGSWELELSSKDSSMNTKFVTLCLLSCCELLGTDINGVIFRRSLSETKVTLWSESQSDSMTKNLSQFFTAEQITGYQWIAHSESSPSADSGTAIDLVSARNQGAVVRSHPVTRYTMKDAMALQHHKSCQTMPNDLHSVDWNQLIEESREYQQQIESEMAQQSQSQSHSAMTSKGAPPPGLGGFEFGSKKPKILRLKPSQTQRELEEKNKSSSLSLSNQKHIARIMGIVRNLYDNYYSVSNQQELDLKLQTILNVEKCPIVGTGYDKEEHLDDEDNSLYDNSLGFAILKCRLLNCQHVIRIASAKGEGSFRLQTFHDSEYAPISYDGFGALSYAAKAQPRRRFKIDLKFCHLLSNAITDQTIFIPDHVQSVADPTTASEYVLLYYDKEISPYTTADHQNIARYHHVNNGVKETYLRFIRGRVNGTLSDLNSKAEYSISFTYDLSKSTLPKKGGSTVELLMESVDVKTNSLFKFYVRKIAVPSAPSPSVAFKYQLVAVKAEFAGKQTTPTLSPTFGGVQMNKQQSQRGVMANKMMAQDNAAKQAAARNNNPSGAGTVTVGQSPAVSYTVNPLHPGQYTVPSTTGTAGAVLTTPQQQALHTAILQSLSPPHGPASPQGPHLQSLTPQQQALNPVNLAAMITPTGPVPQAVAGTPSHGAVLTMNTPNQSAMSLNGQSAFFGYGQCASPQVNAVPPQTHVQTTPIQQQHQYQINNVASLTAPTSNGSIPVPQLMSPAGSVGLPPPANIGSAAQQTMASTMYNVHGVPPATSTPVVHSNTASIQSILMQQQPASVSNAQMNNVSMTPTLTGTNPNIVAPPYSPMTDPRLQSVNSAPVSMNYGDVNSVSVNNVHAMPQSVSNVHSAPPNSVTNNMQNNLSSMTHNISPAATHLGYSAMSHGHTPGGSLNAMTSPGMSGYIGMPMSPVSHSISATFGSLDHQQQRQQQQHSQPFALNSYSMNHSYSTPVNANVNVANSVNSVRSAHNLNQPSMLDHINQGLASGANSLVYGNGRPIRSMPQHQGPQGQHSTVTVVNKNNGFSVPQLPPSSSQQMYQGGGSLPNTNDPRRRQGEMQRMQRGPQQQQQHRGSYGGGGSGMSQGQGRQKKSRGGYGGSGRNEVRGQYRVKGREKKNGRLHDARVNGSGIMGRAHQHHAMPPQRRMRGYSAGNDGYGPNGGQQMQNGQSPQGGQQAQGRGTSFGFPAKAKPIPQNQLHGSGRGAKGHGDKGQEEQEMALNMLSPGSSRSNDSGGNGQSVTPGGTVLTTGISPKTPTMIDHVVDRVYFIAKTQSGSRFVQEKLSDKQYFGLFFKELKGHVAELMVDNFGHYAIEALFTHCDDHERLVLVSNLSGHMPQVACHKQGSFSIQAMMDTLSTEEQIARLVDALNRDVKKIILNHSGHYVILRFLQRYDWPHSKFIHKSLTQHTLDLATDHYGLRVMKAAVDAGPVQEMSAVFASIVKHANTLVENQYGNYIIQHLLDLGPKEVTDTVKEKMHGKFVRYSKQKFSSNVVEKCLRHSTNEVKQGIETKDWATIIVRELLTKAGDLISDKYGNYCLQTALQAATDHPTLLQEFQKSTKPHLDTLRENVKAKWIKLLDSAIEKQRKMNAMPQGMNVNVQSMNVQSMNVQSMAMNNVQSMPPPHPSQHGQPQRPQHDQGQQHQFVQPPPRSGPNNCSQQPPPHQQQQHQQLQSLPPPQQHGQQQQAPPQQRMMAPPPNSM